MKSATRQRNAIRLARERARLRIRRAWDSGIINAKIAQRDRAEDNFLRAKLDRKGTLAFVATLPDGSRIRVEWSRNGRTDQLDLVDADGRATFTGRPALSIAEIIARSTATTAEKWTQSAA